jgi:hypothetical protein
VRKLAAGSLDADPPRRPRPGGWLDELDAALEGLTEDGMAPDRPAAPRAPRRPRPARPETAAPGGRPAGPRRRRFVRVRLPGRRAIRIRPAWAAIGLIWLVISLCIGLLQDGPSEPIQARQLPVFPSGVLRLPTPYGILPTLPPRVPGIGSPGIGLPGAGLPFGEITIAPRMLCLLLPFTEYGPGIDRPERREADKAVAGFLCGVERKDAGLAFAGAGTPSAAQRARFAQLARRGPYAKTIVTGLDTGSAGRRRVTVVFQAAGAGGRPACWRSRLTVAGSGDGISALTAPAPVRCR